MKKILCIMILFWGMLTNTAYAGLKAEITNVINNSGINRSSISISVKNATTGRTVYELNPKMPVSPASVQKIVTTTPAFMLLGEDYRFATKLYKTNNHNTI